MSEMYRGAEALTVTSTLVGPFDIAGESGQSLAEWEVPFHEIAIGSIRRVIGCEQVPPGWTPTVNEFVALHGQLSYERRLYNMLAGLKGYAAQRPEGSAIEKFRENQHDITEALAMACEGIALREPLKVKSPTGTGKTAVIVGLTEGLKHRERHNGKDGVGVLILAHRLDILDQTVSAFQKFSQTITPTVFNGAKKDLSPVTIMSYQSFNEAYKRGYLPRDLFHVVIRDEAHHAYGDETGRNLFAFCYGGRGDDPLLAFDLTATPRSGEQDYEQNVVWAINNGLLAPVSARQVRAASNVRSPYSRSGERSSMMYDEAYNSQIVDEIVSGLASGRRVVVRCLRGDDRKHPEIIKEMLEQRGEVRIRHPYWERTAHRKANAFVIRGDTKSEVRQGAYRIFGDPSYPDPYQLDVLLFVDTLTEGWDAPIAKMLINAAPSQSDVLVEQLLGRVMRPFQRANGSSVAAEAVDFVLPFMEDQVTAADILSRDGPSGMHYRQGAIIGQDLVDLRRPWRGANSAFEYVGEELRPR